MRLSRWPHVSAAAILRRAARYGAALAFAAFAAVPAQAQFTVTTADSAGDVGEYSSLQLNASGNPVIAYWDRSNANLKLATCTAGCFTPTPSWQIVTVDASPGNVGIYPSLQLNGAGNPVVTYWDSTNLDLKMATCTAGCASATPTWQIVVVDGSGTIAGETSSLAFDGAGNPVVSYYFGPSSAASLRMATCTANCASAAPTWQIVTVDATSTNTGLNSSLRFNAAGNPVIAYRDFLNRDLRLATCTANCATAAPTWQLVTVDSAGDVGDNASLALSPAGNPVISYRDATNNQLKLATCTAGCATATPTWQLVNVDAGPYWSSLQLTGAGNPVVSYAGNTAPAGIKVATCTAGCAGAAPSWSFQTVLATGSGNESSLALTAAGVPVLSFQEGVNRDLLFAFGPVAPPAPAPVVLAVNRVGAATVAPNSSQQFTVTFSLAVTGVDAADFALTTTGAIAGAAITGVAGSAATWTVTVNVGGPSGTVRLDVVDNDTIVDGAGTPLGGAGAGNGSFTAGQFYTVASVPPPSQPPADIPVLSAWATLLMALLVAGAGAVGMRRHRKG
jgi:hypothetical protein